MTAALLALWLAVAPPDGRAWSVEPAQSTVRYHVVHKFHRVTGITSTVEGKAVLKPDGQVLAMVRIAVASFDSGDRNRDANMREAIGASTHPFVVFRGIAALGSDAVAASRSVALEIRMQGEVELHGVKRPVVVPLAIELEPGGAGRARGSFEVSLDAFGVERPSLLFVKIEDACRIEVDLALRPAER